MIRLRSSSSSSSSSPHGGGGGGGGGGGLVVHSPVSLDPPLIEALSGLGTVAHIISPNNEHVRYAAQWAGRYPEARVWW